MTILPSTIESIAKRTLWCVILIAASCSKDSDPDPNQNPNPNPTPNPNPNPGTVSITSVDKDIFWGDVMTISGTGFSATKSENIVTFSKVTPEVCDLEYSSDGGDIEIISATTTKLEIRIPKRLNPFGEVACGPEKADVQVKVGDASAKAEAVTFSGLPQIGRFLYHYGGFADPKYHTLGDSVILGARLLGSKPMDSPYFNKLRLSVAGINVPFKWRTVAFNTGPAFVLPIDEFLVMDCPLGEDDYPNARKVTFRFYIEGTDKSAETDLYIQKVPNPSVSCHDCKTTVKKSEGQNLVWTIKGAHMTYTHVRFAPQQEVCGTPQSLEIHGSAEEKQFTIPISVLTIDCSYNVMLVDHCENLKFIGSIVVL